jgi:hypothetical protein
VVANDSMASWVSSFFGWYVGLQVSGPDYFLDREYSPIYLMASEPLFVNNISRAKCAPMQSSDSNLVDAGLLR